MIFRSRRSIGKVQRSSKRSIGASYQMRRNRKRKVLNLFKRLGFIGAFIGVFLTVFIGILVFNISRKLPDVSTVGTIIPAETTKIYSYDGVTLAELHEEENRILIPLEKISDSVKTTVVALEDTDFYSHHGLNFKGIIRALYKDIKARSFVEGGSTITQQLARHFFLTKHKKVERKIAEAILAIQLERKFTKSEILEMYLNQVYWGHNAYGIESAAQLYFNKHAMDLSIAQASLLVGILKGPELYSPFKNFPLAKSRQKTVLNRMAKLKLLTKAEAQKVYQEDIQLTERKKFRYKAPYFTSYVVTQIIEMFGEEDTYSSGMKVYTTLNYSLQLEAESLVKKYLEIGNNPYWIKNEKVPSLNYSQAAMLSIDPRTGHIKVMQGGIDYKSQQFNRTIQAKRQPGSAFKPFVYLAALEKGFSPGTIIEDSPVTYNTLEGPYAPQNYNKKFLGKLPMRKALEKSINVVAIKLNDIVGPKKVVDVARRLGITSDLKPILSLPLGAMEVTMLEVASSYGVLATNGLRVEPVSILRIEDRNGIPLYKHKRKETRVFDSNLIATLVEMMKGVVDYGTGRQAKLPRPVAGKTGTTSDYRDAWFVGFVPQLVTATWVGNDNNDFMNGVTGGWIPAQMWRDFMKIALKKEVPLDFPRPSGLVQRKVNWETSLLATDISPTHSVTVEKYWKGKEPVEYDTTDSIAKIMKKNRQEKLDRQHLLDFFDTQ